MPVFPRLKKLCLYHLFRSCSPTEEAFVWACRDTPIDFQLMQIASQHFVGKQDFTAFSAVHAKDKDPRPR